MLVEKQSTHEKYQPSLDERFLMYIGPINSTAIHEFDGQGNRHARDQHSVALPIGIKPDIDIWEEGTLKVYCPSILLAFPEGKPLKLLNSLLNKAEALLYTDTPLLTAVEETATPDEFKSFISTLDSYIRNSQISSGLAETALKVNFDAYNRSIALQKLFLEENEQIGLDNLDTRTQAVFTCARQKTIFISMAHHYAAEAMFDDQFVNFPYHLPDHVQSVLVDNAPVNSYPEFDRRAYERGFTNNLLGAPAPDAYRFDPILASLIAPFVMKTENTFEHYNGWEDFQKRVINLIKDPVTIQAFDLFAKGMKIPKEFAYFAAYKMCQKDIRKKGFKFLYSPNDAKQRATQVVDEFKDNLEYFQVIDPYLRLTYYEQSNGGFINATEKRIHKESFLLYRRALINRTAIEYVNSVIGTYKFVPWEKSDANFEGLYLPYAVMKSEKARIVNVLCSAEFSPYWKEKGYWFRDALPQLIKSHPSMYSKWFIPLLEKGLIDKTIIQEANIHTIRYLNLLVE